MKYGEEMKIQVEISVTRMAGCWAPVIATSPQFPEVRGDGSGGDESIHGLERSVQLAVANLFRSAGYRWQELKKTRENVDLKASAEAQYQAMEAVFGK